MIEPHAEARAEQRLLDVVRRQRVAGEQHVDVAAANQLAQDVRRCRCARSPARRRAASCRRRAACEAVRARSRGSPSPSASRSRRSTFMNSNIVLFERRAAAETRARRRGRTTIRSPSRTSVIGDAAGRCRRGVDDDAAIHFLIGDLAPVAVEADFGPLVGRAVETFGKRAGDVGRDQPAIVLRRRHGAVVGDAAEDVFAASSRRPRELRPAHSSDRCAPGRSTIFLMRNVPAAAGDQVENLRQDQAIDDVAANLDFLDRCERARGSSGVRWSAWRECMASCLASRQERLEDGSWNSRFFALRQARRKDTAAAAILRCKSLRRHDFTAVAGDPYNCVLLDCANGRPVRIRRRPHDSQLELLLVKHERLR